MENQKGLMGLEELYFCKSDFGPIRPRLFHWHTLLNFECIESIQTSEWYGLSAVLSLFLT